MSSSFAVAEMYLGPRAYYFRGRGAHKCSAKSMCGQKMALFNYSDDDQHTSDDVHNKTQHSRDLLRSHYSITTTIASPPLPPSPYIQQKDGDDILVCTDWKTYLYDICQHHTKQHIFVGHLISLLQICYNISSYRKN